MAEKHQERDWGGQPVEQTDARFAPLEKARGEDGGHLPSGDDQSWREMEALRIAAYDRIGHLPPGGDQAWREREALHLAGREPAQAGGANHAHNFDETDSDRIADDVNDLIAELAKPISYIPEDQLYEPMEPDLEPVAAAPEPYVPVREPVAAVQTVHRGAGGVMLLLVGMVGLVTVALAVPDILTPDFWRAQWAAVTSKPAAMPKRVASIPTLAATPLPAPDKLQPAPDNGPASNASPLTSSEPPAPAEPPRDVVPPPDAAPSAGAVPEAAPTPRPEAQVPHDRRTMVIGRDGTVKYEDAGSRTVPVRRASRRDDRDESGFYAMAPGPDGVLRREFFPSSPETDSQPLARDDVSGTGVYAMAPGPDGVLRYRYFPSEPPR